MHVLVQKRYDASLVCVNYDQLWLCLWEIFIVKHICLWYDGVAWIIFVTYVMNFPFVLSDIRKVSYVGEHYIILIFLQISIASNLLFLAAMKHRQHRDYDEHTLQSIPW